SAEREPAPRRHSLPWRAELVLSRHPEFTAEQVEQVLRETAVDVAAPGRDVEAGYGRIDAARAVSIDSMPVARLTAPAYDARVREPTAVSGTAARPGGQVASWRLLLGPEGGPLAPFAE